jgi:ligand-binding sensor domain-containing protein
LSLPAQECYKVIQDKQGYIWISTEAGLVKFSGTRSMVFNKNNGLDQNSAYILQKGEEQDIWIATSSKRIYQYKNNSLLIPWFSKHIGDSINDSYDQILTLNKLNDNDIFVSTFDETFSIDSKQKKVRRVTPPKGEYDFYFIKTTSALQSILQKKSRIFNDTLRQNPRDIIIRVQQENRFIDIKISSSKFSFFGRVLTTTDQKGTGYIGLLNLLIRVNPDLSYSYIATPDMILNLYCDKNNGLWVGNYKAGVRFFPDPSKMELNVVNMPDMSVTGVAEDHEGGIWCTTLEKGVFYTSSKNVIHYSNIKGLDKKADLLKTFDNKVFTTSGTKEIYKLDSLEISSLQIKHPLSFPVNDILRDGEDYLLASKSYILKADNDFQFFQALKTQDQKEYYGGSQFVKLSNNKIYFIQYGRLFELIKGEIKKIDLNIQADNIVADHNYILIGTQNGAYQFDPEKKILKKFENLSGEVTKILKTGRELWICTKADGIYKIINNTTEKPKQLNLLTRSFFDIEADSSRSLWIASNIGLIKVFPNRKKIEIANVQDGLPTNEIYDLEILNNWLYMSSTLGISMVNKEKLIRPSSLSPIVVKSIYIKNNNVGNTIPSSISASNNIIKISLDILTFKDLLHPRFIYSLKCDEPVADIVNGNELTLQNLQPGNYFLEIYPVNGKGSRAPVSFNFSIMRPWWQKTIVLTVFIVFACIFIYFIAMFLARRIKLKEESRARIQRLLAEYQLTSLQAQMNPHFIFNSINSIQTYILNNNPQEAYDYLAKFSRLVRIVLDNASEKELLLEKELEMITLYLELEQQRFKGQFFYNIIIDPKVNIYEVSLPPMLIQPFVENAIWHGLMPLKKTRKGEVIINIKQISEILHIVITDNGIGRTKSLAAKTAKNHKSIATKLTERRIEVLKSSPGFEDTRILISDLFPDEDYTGTKVQITIPIS